MYPRDMANKEIYTIFKNKDLDLKYIGTLIKRNNKFNDINDQVNVFVLLGIICQICVAAGHTSAAHAGNLSS